MKNEKVVLIELHWKKEYWYYY